MSSSIKVSSANSAGLKLRKYFDSSEDNSDSQENIWKLQVEEIKNQAFQQGRKAAIDELETNYANDMEHKKKEFGIIAESIENKIKDYELSFEKIVLEISFNIAETILKKNLKRDTIIKETLKEASKKIIGADKLVIKLNPTDYELVKSNAHEILGEDFNKIKFEADDKIENGGCFIESEIGNVDGRISSQLNELKKQLKTNYLNDLQ